MIFYVMQWENYLEDFQVTDFRILTEAKEFMAKLEKKEDPKLTYHFVAEPSDLSFGSGLGRKMRRDIYNLMAEEGYEAKPEELITPDRLFIRLETWVKE